MRWEKVKRGILHLPLRASFYRKDVTVAGMAGGPQYGQMENHNLLLGVSATSIILKKEHEEPVRVAKLAL